ncbi:MAG: diphthine--ammonia ligase [Candidatus Methanofastidiosia archaeon]
MRIGALFSGGKDSVYAVYKTQKLEDVVCLISVLSENKESYMFHTPNIGITKLQAKAMGLPLIQEVTPGIKEKELKDLKNAIQRAHHEYDIGGVVTGAIESVYQAMRIQRICDALHLWCFNPLWLKDQVKLLQEMVDNGFTVIISGIFAYPLDETWLGREIDHQVIKELVELNQKYRISPSGEGGEIETTVIDAPFFQKRIEIKNFEIESKRNAGVFYIKDMELVEK